MEAQQQQQWMMSAQAQSLPSAAQPSYSSQPYHQPTTLEEVRTLWIGDLPWWADEAYLNSWFAQLAQVLSIKVIRNKITGHPEGYGFVEFDSHATAKRILESYGGTQIPGTEVTLRLNWASFGIGERRPDSGPEYSIFVGDLAPDVSDIMLQETFRTHYPSVRGAKVVTDSTTGRSKGYGFVKFVDETERNQAMTEMNGQYCSTRPMRISAATPKKTTGLQQQYAVAKGVYQTPVYAPAVQPVPVVDYDTNNTTVFIGNLDPNVTEEELRQLFLQFGEIFNVKIPAAKGCGFVQYGTRANAEEAIQRMQGAVIGQQVVRLSWGRNPRQDLPGNWQADPSQWGSAYYGYGQGYDAYSYGATHDPSQYPYEGAQDMGAMTAAAPAVEQREELYDPLATPDVDKLNAAYLAVHESAILGRPLWQRTSTLS
ncbi:hypothetical protein RJ639_018723 [Escallonia herrerae]|uniref:RRM domain-containing protein n=1 Tax=Escallonia herrerae TaxID=1293975 RepID=A0AA88VA56_9ASTE|nr:hypothetical protein RJ639_018723 [Escallonia herrerae]